MDQALNLCQAIYGEEMFIKVRVGNLTFDGVDSKMLHLGDFGGPQLGGAISDNIPFDRFGWFYDRNGSESYDGLFEMFTGEDDIYKVSFCPHIHIYPHISTYPHIHISTYP